MADNVGITGGAYTATIATTDVGGGVHVQKVSVSNAAGTILAPALDVTLTAGTQKAIARGGVKGATADADVTSSAVDADHQALDVFLRGGIPIGGTAVVDQVAFTVGTTPATPIAGVYQAAADSVADGQAGALRMTIDRRQIVQLQDILTPAGDSVINDTLNGIGVELKNVLEPAEDGVSTTGLVAHGAALSSDADLRPVLTGAHAIAFGATPTPVNAAALARLIATRHGILWTLAGHPNQLTREFHITAAKTDADLLGAIAATDKVVVTKLLVTLAKATTVNVGVRIGFGAATLPAAADAGTGALGIIGSHSGIEPGAGFLAGKGRAPIGIGPAGEELRITNDAPTGGSLRVVVTYFTVVES